MAENIGLIQSISSGNYRAKLIQFIQSVSSNNSIYGTRISQLKDSKLPKYVIMAMQSGCLSDNERGQGIISAILQNPSSSLTETPSTIGTVKVYMYQYTPHIGTVYGNGNYDINHYYLDSRGYEFGINHTDGSFIINNLSDKYGSTS